MNIELLKEIHKLKDEKVSDTDIASLIGISKANILLMLRIEKVVKEDLKISNESFEKKIKSFEINIQKFVKENEELKKKISTLEVLKKEFKNKDFISENEELKNKISTLEDTNEYLKSDIEYLNYHFESIPKFIKSIFLNK
jgi:chaperonin cofactor prefoldin